MATVVTLPDDEDKPACECGADKTGTTHADYCPVFKWSYQKHKKAAARRQQELTKAGQDIAPIPEVVNRDRKAFCRLDLETFARTYFPKLFYLPSSKDLTEAIRKSQQAILEGGQYALAMPRGGGKTTNLVVSTIWSLLYGHHWFVMFIAATDDKAVELMDKVKKQLAGNEMLLEDFPEVCYPIRALDNRANRAKGQHVGGDKTHIVWGAYEIVLPYMKGSPASCNVLRVAGITGSKMRGSLYYRPHDGNSARPSMAFVDDPQDDEVAKSFIQIKSRLDIIEGTIPPMAGPGKKMTVFCLCTVIEKNDVADTLLDRSKSPEWRGDKYKILYKFPDNMNLWEEYREIRQGDMRNGGDGSRATEFYAERRQEMDAGAVVAWEHNHKPNQLSAIQFAMDWFFAKPRVFWSEYQNCPLGDEDLGEQLDSTTLQERQSGHTRAELPLACQYVTAFMDVQESCLFWMVCGWDTGFGGTILDYGSCPDQQRLYFTKADLRRTLAMASPGAGMEGALHAGLAASVPKLLAKEYLREDGASFKIEKFLIDASDGDMTKVIDTWIKGSGHNGRVMPSHGRGDTARNKPWDEWKEHAGEKLGTHWLIPVAGKRGLRYVLYSANFWKTFIYNRLRTAVGDRGALTLFGKRHPESGRGLYDHMMLCDHLTSEYWVETVGRGRTLHEWMLHVGRDNEFFDTLAGCAVAASMLGVELKEASTKPTERRKATSEDYEKQRRAFEKRRGF